MRYVLIAILMFPLVIVPVHSQEKKKDKIRDKLMETKLKEAQLLLDGLATNDFDRIEKSAEELKKISVEAHFRKAFKTPQYEMFANSFQRAAETTIEKAKKKNLDGATLAYMDMTLTCVRCHQHTREVQIGALPRSNRERIELQTK